MHGIIKDRRSIWILAGAGVLNVVQWIVVVTWPHSNVAPLHYTIYFGLDLTGPAWQLYMIPGLGMIILLIHTVLSGLRESPLWSRLWALTAMILILLLSAAMATLRVVALP